MRQEDKRILGDSLVECYGDVAIHARTFFPERFYRQFDPLHDDVFRIVNSRPGDLGYKPRKVIAAPRGTGKTSLSNLALPAQKILFRDRRYVVPVSASATLALQQSENLRRELTQNVLIKQLFGDIKTGNFSKDQWVVNIAGQEICVMPRGAGQQVRGMLFGNHRPDLIIVDDLENPDEVMSEEQRRKRREWFYADLMNCVDRGRDDWEIIVVGTVLHEASLLNELLESPHWMSARLEICDDNLKSNAPNFMSDQEIKELYDHYNEEGELDVFYREYRNNPIASGKDAAFRSAYFSYYEEGELALNHDPNIENIIIVDPARTTKMTSAESGIIGVGVNMRSNEIFVRYVLGGRFHPDELYDEIIKAIQHTNADVLAVETTGLEEFVVHPMLDHLHRNGVHVEFVDLKSRAGHVAGVKRMGQHEKAKISRVRSLIYYYRTGLVKHNKANSAALEAQLLSFPRPRRWDLMDPLGYVVELLEKGKRYMLPEDAYVESKADILAEYAELDDDYRMEPLDKDWKVFK